MSENHDIVDDNCSNHVLNTCYMIGYICMLKVMLKVGFGWNCGLLWII